MKIQFTLILLYSTWWLVDSSSLKEELQSSLATDLNDENDRLDGVESQRDSVEELKIIPTTTTNLRSRLGTKITSRFTHTESIADTESKIDRTHSVSSERQLQTSITITRISVRNSNTGKEIITDLKDGQIIELNQYGLTQPSEINFQAYYNGDPTILGSIGFGYDLNLAFSADNFDPFTFCGNFGPQFFFACPKLTIGSHTILATPFSSPSGTGSVLGPTFIRKFNVVFQVATPIMSPPTFPPFFPVPPPISAPRSPPILAPRPPPTLPPRPPFPPPLQCPVPMFVGEWEKIKAYPLNIAESIGGTMVNSDGTKDIVVFSGFANEWTATTRAVYAYNTKQQNFGNATWRRMDDIPHPIGLTHSGYVIMKGGKVMYMCGGYVGGTPGAETNLCYKYEHQKPLTKQWSALPPLPQGRSGGALLYLVINNSLLYATGATRSDPKDPLNSTDYNTVWELSLNGVVALNKWEQRRGTPYKGNHVSFASVGDRAFVFGGQDEEDEHTGNLANVTEYIVPIGRWTRRKSMNFPRGHTSSSTHATPNGCGILTAGGAIQKSKTSDISFYSVTFDTWTSIGNLPKEVNTPVCDLVEVSLGNWYLFCVTGFVHAPYAYRRRIANI